MSDQDLPPPPPSQSPAQTPPPPPRSQNVTPPMYSASSTPAVASAQGAVGEVRAYEPGAVKSQGGGCLSKGVVGFAIFITVAIVGGVVFGIWWAYNKAQDTVKEVQAVVEDVFVHPDCALLKDGQRVPTDFFTNGSLDLSCGSGTGISPAMVLSCASSGREYAQNTHGYAFLDDLIYHDTMTVAC